MFLSSSRSAFTQTEGERLLLLLSVMALCVFLIILYRKSIYLVFWLNRIVMAFERKLKLHKGLKLIEKLLQTV